MSWREEDGDWEPAKGNLLSIGRHALISVLLGRRRLVAFTGSGLSLIYGGVTWPEAVNLILETTLDQIDLIAKPSLRPIDLQRLADQKAVLESYYVDRSEAASATTEKLGTEDLLVAIELAEDARELLKSISRRDPRGAASGAAPKIESANEIFAKLSGDDSLAVRKRLIERINGYDLKRAKKRIKGAAIDRLLARKGLNIQDLAARFYDLDWIATKAALPDPFVALARELDLGVKAAMGKTESALPIEKRSIVAPLLGIMTTQERRELLGLAIVQTSKDMANTVPRRPLLDPLAVLKEHFDIERFLTLNYDWELERLLMIPDLIERHGRAYTIDRALREEEIASDESDQPGLRLTRRMPDGRFTESDVYRPRASAHLYEFALNSPDHAAHIVHLHGRVDDPRNMVARDDDYNRVYRRESSNPRSLERALDVALTGNPILFVGVGLSEAEITRAFRLLVANGRVTPENPAFALMQLTEKESAGWRRQVSSYQRFGLHILHYGHPSRGTDYSLATHKDAVQRLKNRLEEFKKCLAKTPRVLAASNKLIEPAQLELLEKPLGDATPLSAKAILAGDNRMYGWLVERLSKDYDGLVDALKVRDPDRLAGFADGCLDYLERLSEKLTSVALVHEIQCLAVDTDRALKSVSGRLPEREAPLSVVMRDLDVVTCLRHLDPAVLTPPPPDVPKLRCKDETVLDEEALKHRCALVFGDTGIGKGTFLRRLYDRNFRAGKDDSHVLVINFTFGIEIDSTIALVYLFLMSIYKGAGLADQLNKFKKMEEALARHERNDSRPAYIIFTGIDRLFDDKAQPISADFDRLMRLLLSTPAAYGHNFIVIASTPIRRWFDREFDPDCKGPPWPVFTLAGPASGPTEGACERPLAGIAALYRDTILELAARLDWQKPIQRQIDTADRESKTSVPTGNVRSTPATGFLRTLLSLWPEVVKADAAAKGKENDCVALDMAIVNLLALVGAPLELEIFRFDPVVRDVLERIDRSRASWGDLVQHAALRLARHGLAARVPVIFVFDRAKRAKEGNGETESRFSRIALHRVVLTELRTRLGVPLGDAPLSNTFSLSLAASLPVDVILPGPDVRKRLKTVLGHFRTAWRDVRLGNEVQGRLNELRGHLLGLDPKNKRSSLDAEIVGAIEDLSVLTRAAAVRSAPMGACLRAAANIVRSFFSVSSLVALNPAAFPSQPGQRTEFEVHKQRIRELFSAVRELHDPIDIMIKRLTALEPAMRTDEGRAAIAAWQEALELATRTGKGRAAIAALQPDDSEEKSKFPPLYGGEIVWLHNERGVISLIQGDLYEAEFSFAQALKANHAYNGDDTGHYRRRIDLNRSLLIIERGKLREGRVLLKQLKEDVEAGKLHEGPLLKPLIEGYLGLVAHLNGRSEDAEGHYEAAVNGAIATEQRRALGLFQMRRAALRRSRGRLAEARDDIAEAIRSAEASCQLDVLWRARLIQAQILGEGANGRMLAEQALDYADAVGLHRIAVEALIVGANFAMAADDLDGAAEMVAKAMVRVTRYGMILRRISLRVMMGEIMLRQGDPGGWFLLRRAIAHAERVGYESGIQHAQMKLVKRPTVTAVARLAGSAPELSAVPPKPNG